MIFSSGSVRMYGRNFRTERSQCAPALERLVREERVGGSVVEVGDLEPEEQELRVERGALLGQPRDERSARRVGHVRREPEMGVVDRAREDRLDPLALVDRLASSVALSSATRP